MNRLLPPVRDKWARQKEGGISLTFLLSLFHALLYNERINQDKSPVHVQSCFLAAEGASLSQLQPEKRTVGHESSCLYKAKRPVGVTSADTPASAPTPQNISSMRFCQEPDATTKIVQSVFVFTGAQGPGEAVSPAIQESVIWV